MFTASPDGCDAGLLKYFYNFEKNFYELSDGDNSGLVKYKKTEN